jgi:hypothetical protein
MSMEPRAQLPLQIGPELLRRYADKISKKYGVSIPGSPRELGRGTRGIAYDVGGGKVLKITDDQSEAKAASVLKTKQVDFAVHVYGVFELAGSGYYGILQELLQPLPGHIRASVERAMVALDFRERLEESGDLNHFFITFDRDMQELESQGETREIAKLTSAFGVLEKYGIFEIAKGLQQLGIQFTDYHTGLKDGNQGNLMMRGDKVVVLDLGHSKVQGGGAIDVVENVFWEANATWAWRARLMKMVR